MRDGEERRKMSEREGETENEKMKVKLENND
jgi:hypothetical protein